LAANSKVFGGFGRLGVVAPVTVIRAWLTAEWDEAKTLVQPLSGQLIGVD
jgi:hypothetical protein